MAEAVLRAFEESRHLVVEAGTGTGKTLAYLVPAVAFAVARGQRVIISTGTKNLQEQLMEKDVPFLQSILPRPFKAAAMKGRSNYACLQRIKRAESQAVFDDLKDIDHFDYVRRWAQASQTGDRAELTELPENLSFWRHIDARSEICIGQKCPDYDPCFITRMRQRAQDADIVIVNHHLFFADLAIRGSEYGQVLPDYGAVIFDEAHGIEDVAAEYFGSQVSNYQIDDLLRDLVNLPITDTRANDELTKAAARVGKFGEMFWAGFREGRGEEGRTPILPGTFARRNERGEIEATALGDIYLKLDSALARMDAVLDPLTGTQTQGAEIENTVRRIREARFNLEFIVAGDDKKYVYWMERRGRGLFLRASPIDVGGLLQDKLFERTETVVLTSATLSSAGSFSFIRERLGLDADKTDELEAPSSYDYARQAVLYLPRNIPEPRSPQWTAAAVEEIVRLLEITEGRAFVLSTSNYGMRALYDQVAPRIDFPCFVQGSLSKAGVLERFRRTPNAVLFATSSFWQGVDVRGEQLSCVIIDKLPFAVPSDPVVGARQRAIDDAGGSSFFEYSVPQAIIALKQGLGRLIRSSTDRGVLAVLDPRLRTKNYGRLFLKSLPPVRVTSDLRDVAGMFAVEEEPARVRSGPRIVKAPAA